MDSDYFDRATDYKSMSTFNYNNVQGKLLFQHKPAVKMHWKLTRRHKNILRRFKNTTS